MSDYISREAALDALGVTKNATKYGGNHSGYDTRMLYEIHDALTGISAADVVLVVHGRWLPQKENHEFKEAWMKCSVCGYPVSKWTGNTNFCPNCGAKMDGKGEE